MVGVVGSNPIVPTRISVLEYHHVQTNYHHPYLEIIPSQYGGLLHGKGILHANEKVRLEPHFFFGFRLSTF